MANRKLNIPLGSRYGSLLVIGPETKKGRACAITCKCDCGVLTVVTLSNLNIGAVQSCGCSHIKPEHKNLQGKTFGRLTVIDDAVVRRGTTRAVKCRCECGNTVFSHIKDMVDGRLLSCGCLSRMKKPERELKRDGRFLVRQNRSPEYAIWWGIVTRCENPNSPNFEDYGGRGITLCDHWRKSFAHFLADMGARPSSRHTVERIDNNKGYEPGNCKWTTYSEQALNRRNTVMVEYQGKVQPLAALSNPAIGTNPQILRMRVKSYGWPIERAITEPVKTSPKKIA